MLASTSASTAWRPSWRATPVDVSTAIERIEHARTRRRGVRDQLAEESTGFSAGLAAARGVRTLASRERRATCRDGPFAYQSGRRPQGADPARVGQGRDRARRHLAAYLRVPRKPPVLCRNASQEPGRRLRHERPAAV